MQERVYDGWYVAKRVWSLLLYVILMFVNDNKSVWGVSRRWMYGKMEYARNIMWNPYWRMLIILILFWSVHNSLIKFMHHIRVHWSYCASNGVWGVYMGL